MHIRTRIAPSPTGFVHIGTLRTILWNYFMARQAGGEFLIRIEDTDQERYVPGSIEGLLEVMERMGVSWDEGPFLESDGSLGQKGDCGPYIQTQRLEIYTNYIAKLLEKQDAYYCFCSHERLEAMREEQMALKQNPKYDRKCLSLSAEEVAQRRASGEECVIRMKVPEGRVSFDDAIRGTISFDLKDVDDQVLIKSNGIPTYHFAVVVDDYLMKISHVLRGEEWLSSMPKQIVLHEMLGIQIPVYAHVPLILGADKKKLSKRKGDVSVAGYLEKGYVPEALINFLGTLGFNPTSDREIFSQEELIASFNLAKVNKGGAVMNIDKLDWMNKHYISTMSTERYRELVQRFVTLDLQDPMVLRALMVEKQRITRLTEVANIQEQYFATQQLREEDLLGKKGTKETSYDALVRMEQVVRQLDDAVLSSPALIEEVIKTYIASNGLQNGLVLWPLRLALSTRLQSPSPFEYLYVLPREVALERIRQAQEILR